MLIIGSHVSYSGEDGLVGSVLEAINYGANAFMFYTGAPQNTIRKKIDPELTDLAKKIMQEKGIDINNVIVHAPYIINLANNRDIDKYNFSISFLKQEIERVEKFGISKIVLHPGSHVGLGTEKGIENIIYALNQALTEKKGPDILLETMSGKGTEIGRTFEELKEIIDGVKINNRVKVCFDTCHVHDGGYDLSTFDKVLEEFDEVIGLEKLACVHINDSKNINGSGKDRHENFGFGNIGFNNLLEIVYNNKLKKIPKILETPYVTLSDDNKKRAFPPYKQEIEMIRNKEFNPNLINDVRTYHR